MPSIKTLNFCGVTIAPKMRLEETFGGGMQ